MDAISRSIHSKFRKIFSNFKYIAVFILMVAVFHFNTLNASSSSQFKTWKDGLEALILGKIFAEKIGLYTGWRNLGFVEIGKCAKGPDVLAIYPRVDSFDALAPADLSHENWRHGYSRTGNAFILAAASTGELGYASNELVEGQKIVLADGIERAIVRVDRSGNFLNVWCSDPMMNSVALTVPEKIKVLDDRSYIYEGYSRQFGIQAVVLS